MEAKDHEGALFATMDELGLEEAHSAQVFEEVDYQPEDHATYFDDISSDNSGGYSFEKKWRWNK